MKTLVKIVFTLWLTMCLNAYLHAQVENKYYVKYEILSHRADVSGWFCKDASSRIEMYAFVGAVPKGLILNTNTLSAMPEKFRFTGYLSIGSDAPRYYANYERAYIKGMNPFTLAIDESFDTGCERSIYAQSKITVDDPVEVTCNLSKSGNYTFATETENLTLRIGKFYENGTLPQLQVSADEKHSWKNIQSVRPNETINLSYHAIVGKLDVEFETLLGKPLYFRVLKTLMDNTQTYGKEIGAIVFYPEGIKFDITSTKQTYCKEGVELTVHLENSDDAKYMNLNPDNYSWVMAQDSAKLTNPFYCTMTHLDGNKFLIEPDMTPSNLPKTSPFIEEEDVIWYLQLQDQRNQDQFFCVRKFTIPAKPKKITVAQMPAGYTINGQDYHVPSLSSKFAMLKISDPSYDSHHRTPYYVNIGNGHEIAISNLGAATLKDLAPAEQEKLRAAFETEYAEIRKNTAARRNFANTQWGEVLPESVMRIAMPKDGSFFLYLYNYRLYMATFISGAQVEIRPIAQDHITTFDITPDGAYCIYERNYENGLYVLPLTGSIPLSGQLLSEKSSGSIINNEEFPNHIYKNSSGNWEYISMYNGTMYSISIPDGKETIISSLSEPVHVLENGMGFYETPLSSSNSIYKISKVNISNKTTSAFYSYSDSRTDCVYKLYKTNAGTSKFPYTDCVFESSYPQKTNGDLYASIDDPDQITLCGSEHCTGSSGPGLQPREDLPAAGYLMLDDKNCYREKNIYKKQCNTYRANQHKALITVAPNGSFVIISNNNTTYYKISSSGLSTSISSGSNFKISPNNKDFVFTSNGHTYKNSTAAENLLIQDRESSNICFSDDGKYFLFVDPATGYVYKQYMSNEDALAGTEPAFKENAWNQWLNSKFGTKVSSNYIRLNTAQTWTLRDADGCVYDPFRVEIKAPSNPNMRAEVISPPTSACAHDGVATIIYEGGGNAPFSHPSGVLQNPGNQIFVGGLGYGDNIIQFADGFGNKSYSLTISIGGGANISNVLVTPHTCATPNGKIRVSVAGMNGQKTYRLKNTGNPSGTYSQSTTSNSYEFTGIPSGMYKVSVSYNNCDFEKTEEYEVESHIFDIANIAVTPSTTLEGNGSATITLVNLTGTAEWINGEQLFDSRSVNQSTVATRSGGISPGTYALSIRSNTTGCTINAGITIDKPACSGKINLNYTKDGLRISTGYLAGNALFDPYTFRVVKSTGEIITEGKMPDVEIRQPGAYALYAWNVQANDLLPLHEFTFPVNPIKASVNIVPPLCPQGTGAVTLNIQGGGFGNQAAIKVSVDGLHYIEPQKFNLNAAAYDAYMRDTVVRQKGDLTIHSTLLQPLSFVVSAAEPVSARVTYTPPSCAGSADGKIHLSDFTGGSGEYEYKINDNAWRDTTMAISELGPGVYNVYLRDKKYQCETQHLYSVKLQNPDTLKVNFTVVEHPTCELGNGLLAATVQGGDGNYRYDWYHNSSLLGSADYAVISEINSGHTLWDGFYKLQIQDGKQCVVSDTVTLRPYHNPRAESVKMEPVSCAGAKDGMVEVLAVSGTSPVDSAILQHRYLPYTYRNERVAFAQLDTGKYTLTLRDTLGCYTTTPYPVYIDEPKPLRIAVDTILPVIEKGSRTGKIIVGIYDGNAGRKTVLLKRADGMVIDSLLYVNNVASLSFTQYAGSYRIEATDSKGCRVSTGVLQIEEPANSLKIVIKEVRDARCKSQVGSITVEGVGGWGEYRYKHGQDANFTTLNTFDNLYPGRYVVTVIDKLGATYSETMVIHEPKDSLAAKVVSRLLPTCGNNGAFSIQLSGGTPPYTLYDHTDTVSCAQPQTITWANRGSGNYLLHLMDTNGCRFELEEDLPGASLLVIEKMDVTQPAPPAVPDGEIKVTVRGGMAPYTYQWVQDATTILTNNSPVLAGIPAGHYGVEVTDAEGCTVHEEVMLTDSSYVAFTVLASGHETAFKAANGYAVLLADTPLSDYVVITPAHSKITYASSAVTDNFRVQNDTVYLHGLGGGKWVITGTNASGRHAVSEILINSYNRFAINTVAVSPVSKKGASDGQVRIDVRGGGGGNRYSWTTSESIAITSEDYEYGSMLRDVPAGSYTVTIEDCYGNILQKEIVVKEPEQALTLKIVGYQNQSCQTFQDAYVRLSADGGWGDYQFRHRAEPYFGNGATYRNLETAGHYFYVTDRQGVTDSLFIEITAPEYVRTSENTITPVRCKNAYDGGVLFTVTGGTAPYFLSELDSETWKEGRMATGLQAGHHTFVFRDKNNCAGQDTVTVYVPEPDSLLFKNIAVTHTTCEENNGKIQVIMQGGIAPYQYRWTNSGNMNIGNGIDISALAHGTYRLQVTDNNGCTQQLEQHIQPSARPDFASLKITPVLCYGDTTGVAEVIAVLPGTPYAPYSLAWSNGDQGAFSSRFHEGTHHVTVRDTNDCATTRYFEITQPDSLHLMATEIKDPHCYGYSDGHIFIETLGGVEAYVHQWSNGATTPNVENLTKGNYRVEVTDANGCTYRKSFILEEPGRQTVDLGEDVVICSGNTYLLDGKDYTAYRWYTAEGDISDERYLRVGDAGHYFLEATDARGCPVFGEMTLDVKDSALEADFLLASEAALGDTLMLFELSNLTLDSLKWEYDPAAFECLFWDNGYDYSYVLSLHSLQTGLHDIGLRAYSGGCYSHVIKPVNIATQPVVPASIHKTDYHREPLISEVKLYPNPNSAVFTVEVALREMADVRLILLSVVPGARVDERIGRGSDYYQVKYNLPKLATGVYMMMVVAGDERRTVKLIVAE
jgi:hypothetical protein